MTQSAFQKIRDAETPDKSYRWYADMIRKVGVGTYSPARVMRSDIGEFVSSVDAGSMYLFAYDPKTEGLPYYDTYPLVIPFRKLNNGFVGLNMHYLPPMLRGKLLGRMLEHTNNKNITETTRFRLQWSLLDNASRFPGVNACVKRYLYSQVQSRVFRINPQDWKKSIMLPIENFVGASSRKVHQDSIGKM